MVDEAMTSYTAWIADVEKVNDVPVVIAPWGFKKIEVNGKNYLAPMTEKDAREAFAEIGQPFQTNPHCSRDPFSGCHPQGGCKGCTDQSTSGGWICYCTR